MALMDTPDQNQAQPAPNQPTPNQPVEQQAAPAQPVSGAQQGGDVAAQLDQFINTIKQKVKPEDQQSLDRVVVAGMKIMFSQQTHKYMQDALSAKGDMATKIGMGIVQLMLMMLAQSKGSMPMQIAMPAASILLARACQYVLKTGGEMTMEVFSEALKVMSVGLADQIQRRTQQHPTMQKANAMQTDAMQLQQQQGQMTQANAQGQGQPAPAAGPRPLMGAGG